MVLSGFYSATIDVFCKRLPLTYSLKIDIAIEVDIDREIQITFVVFELCSMCM